MKKFVALFLALLLALPLLSSCARLNTDGLLTAAPDLIRRSAFFNDIYYGAGIPYNSLAEPAIGVYYYADPDFLSKHGFSTVDELKAMTQEVFSSAYCEDIFQYAFSGFAAEGGYVYARYSSSQAVNLRDEEETILVSSTQEGMLNQVGSTAYHYDTLRIAEVGGDYAKVAITVTVTYLPDEEHPDGYTQEDELLIRFVYQDGWRIDSATY